jgi:hypothetical protein
VRAIWSAYFRRRHVHSPRKHVCRAFGRVRVPFLLLRLDVRRRRFGAEFERL